jgi:hypothetical protein
MRVLLILGILIAIGGNLLAQQTCCEPYKVYSNTNMLPDVTSVVQYIHAGNYPENPGPVSVMSNQDVQFIAGNYIRMDKGFQVYPGGKFIARIGPCASAPLSVTPIVELNPCDHRLIAGICNPGGIPFTVEWSTGARDVIAINVKPSTTTNYWVKVTNLNTGKVIQKNYTVVPDYFNDIPTVFLNSNGEIWKNGFSPASNDISVKTWYPGMDNIGSNDGVRRKAYNAYSYRLQIWSRWDDSKAVDISGFTKGAGFTERDVFWNGKKDNTGGALPVATYYAILTLNSCVATREFHGDITVLSQAARADIAEVEWKEDASEIKAFPNPAKDMLTLSLPEIQGEYTIALIDNLGKTVYTGSGNTGTIQIPVGEFRGTYTLKITSGEYDYVSNVVLTGY